MINLSLSHTHTHTHTHTHRRNIVHSRNLFVKRFLNSEIKCDFFLRLVFFFPSSSICVSLFPFLPHLLHFYPSLSFHSHLCLLTTSLFLYILLSFPPSLMFVSFSPTSSLLYCWSSCRWRQSELLDIQLV